jgi:6-phosphogluconolactonase
LEVFGQVEWEDKAMGKIRKHRRSLWFAIFACAALLASNSRVQSSPKTADSGRSVLYAASGPELIQFDVDLANASLTRRASVTLPDAIQEAWPHPSHKFLYVTWSNGVMGSVVPDGEKSPHGVSAFRIDPATGALQEHGQPISLPERAVFMTTDMDGKHIIVAHPEPSALTVYAVKPDGTLGSRVPQGKLDFGIYAHQVRMDPSNKAVILVTRGNGPTANKAEDPGAIKVFNYKNGLLSNRQSIAPNGGYNFQVRHLDFHPSGKWDYVTLERQNKVFVFKRSPDGSLGETPLFMKDPLPEPASDQRGQAVSSIHVHPNGRFLYVANRGSRMIEFQGKRVFAGGGNNIAVFTINQETGEPTLIQNEDTRGATPRTFSIDATGKLLVVANQSALPIRTGNGIGTLPACLSVFRIGDDGKLTFVRKYDIDTSGNRNLFWTGFVSLPGNGT